MSETEADHARPPRFPYVAAALYIACVGAAAWTWMRFSYCWHVTPDDFWTEVLYERSDAAVGTADDFHNYRPTIPDLAMSQRYVRVRGRVWHLAGEPDPPFMTYTVRGSCAHVTTDIEVPGFYVYFTADRDDLARTMFGAEVVATGRARLWYSPPHMGLPPHVLVDVKASRFHPASIAGLVVGAMGVFVFSVALRHWLNRRRGFFVGRAEAET